MVYDFAATGQLYARSLGELTRRNAWALLGTLFESCAKRTFAANTNFTQDRMVDTLSNRLTNLTTSRSRAM